MKKGTHHTIEVREKMSRNSPKYWTGKCHTKETKEKMSLAKRGKNNPMWNISIKGEDNSRWGKHHSEEARRKMRENSPKYWLGKHHTKKTRRKMSLSRIGNKNRLGTKCSEETRKKISISNKGRKLTKKQRQNRKGIMANEKHPMWKGDEVNYKPLHQWIKRHKPKSKFCEKCKKKKKLTLSNIKNHRYTRNINDYKWFCYSCHRKFDLKQLNNNKI